VLVHQWFGDAGRLGDVVHGGGPVAPPGEELEGDRKELLASSLGGQPPCRCLGGRVHGPRCYRPLMRRRRGPPRRSGRSARLKCRAAIRWLCATTSASGSSSQAERGAAT